MGFYTQLAGILEIVCDLDFLWKRVRASFQ